MAVWLPGGVCVLTGDKALVVRQRVRDYYRAPPCGLGVWRGLNHSIRPWRMPHGWVLAGTCRVGMLSRATPVVGILEIDSMSAAKWLGLGNRLG